MSAIIGTTKQNPVTTANTAVVSEITSLTKMWNACIYVRLSREDGDKAESDSIVNQKALIKDYAATHPDIIIRSERVDDGYSGTDFNRPDFIAMVDDVKAGLIDCIIVKDLSRFGRNWIETGRYIEQIFPFMGVRFIAINDFFDSIAARNTFDSITLPFKNLMNDVQARDTSIKIRSHLDSKREKGQFIGAFAAYGYVKSEENRNKLIIDDFAADVVRDIFRWRIEGMSNQGIANRLNDMGILSPHEYKKEKGMKVSTPFKTKSRAMWSAVAVGRILVNEVYLGVLEQGKRISKSLKVKKRENIQKNEWIRVEGTHEPIVSREDFFLIAELLRNDTRISPVKDSVYLFSGLVKCRDCSQNMVRKLVPAGGKKYAYYVCVTNRQSKVKGTASDAGEATKACSPHNISEKLLEASVLQSIRIHIDCVVQMGEILEFIETMPMKRRDAIKIEGQITAKEKELLKYQVRITKLYEDLQDGIVDNDEFETYKTNFSRRCDEAKRVIELLNEELADIFNNSICKYQWMEYFKRFSNIKSLNRSILVKLVEQIFVGEKNRLEIKFRYQNQFERALSYTRTAENGAGRDAKSALLLANASGVAAYGT